VMIDKYGADALRLSLISGIAPGTDIRYSEEKIEPQRNFLNKLWNAARFVLMNIEGKAIRPIADISRISSAGKWILKKLDSLVRLVTRDLERYDLGLAYAKIYDFVWSDFCDWYIELTKTSLQSSNVEEVTEAASILHHVLKTSLKLLHPFAPFVTEVLYSELKTGEPTIMTSAFPQKCKRLAALPNAKNFELIREIIKSIRNLRVEMSVQPSQKVSVTVVSEQKAYIEKNAGYIKRLANVTEVNFVTDKSKLPAKTANIVLSGAELFIPLGELIDFEKERARLTRELERLTNEVSRGEKLLSNEAFVQKAPPALIENEKAKLEDNKSKAIKVQESINSLN